MERYKESGEIALTALQYTLVKVSTVLWPLAAMILWVELGWLMLNNLLLGIIIAVSCLPIMVLSWFSYKIMVGPGGYAADEETTEE